MKKRRKPFFISIPHSGETVPREVTWLKDLPEKVLMCDVDRFVDRLYDPVLRETGIPFAVTPWHRYVVDLNRLPEDVDASSVQGHANAAGKFWNGLHWVRTTREQTLMLRPISMSLHEELVRKYFSPFHDQVRAIYQDFKTRGAQTVYHLDAHSMPSKGTTSHRDPGQMRADIVVSDWEGKSCGRAFKDLVITAYEKAGLKVAYNWPYLGGRVTQTYGKPSEGQETIQVEINRALYMDEDSKQWIPERAESLSRKLTIAVRQIYADLPADEV